MPSRANAAIWMRLMIRLPLEAVAAAETVKGMGEDQSGLRSSLGQVAPAVTADVMSQINRFRHVLGMLLLGWLQEIQSLFVDVRR
jgi:hypothetical protein